MANPWDVFPREAHGDPGCVELYHSVGYALSLWEVMESALGELYVTIIQSESRTALAAYGSVVASSGRIDMVVAAAEADVSDAGKAIVPEIRQVVVKEIGKLAGRRNEIAHGHVAGFDLSDAPTEYFLVPPDYNTRKQMPVHHISTEAFPFSSFKYAYTSAQVLAYSEHFWTYTNKLYGLTDRLRELRKKVPPKASPPPKPAPPKGGP